MKEMFSQNKELIAFIFSILSIILFALLKFFKDWRDKIWSDVYNKREVSVNILQERFISGIIAYIKNVIDEKENKNIPLELIYKRPGHIQLITELSKNGEKINKIHQAYNILEFCSSLMLILCWSIISLLILWLFVIFLKYSSEFVNNIFLLIAMTTILAIIVLATIMFKYDRNFYKEVKIIIKPEL